jgi:general secretion pathway protein J
MTTACRKHGCENAAGFTLLEALVAMALTGMILTGVATITAQWLPNWNRGFARVQGNEILALGLERMIADMAAAEFIPANRESPAPVFEGTDHSVTFVRSALAPNAPPGLEIVRIAETASAGGPSLVRAKAPFFPAAKDFNVQPRFGDPVVLLRAPYLVSLSYAGPDRIWKDAWWQESQLPMAIRVTVRDATTRREIGLSTATLVHAEIPAKCVSAKSLEDCLALLKPSSQSADSTNSHSVKAAGP